MIACHEKLKDYKKKKSVEKLFKKKQPFIICFCIFNLDCVTSQSLQYGGIYDSHLNIFKPHHNFLISRPILERLNCVKINGLLSTLLQDKLTTYTAFPFKLEQVYFIPFTIYDFIRMQSQGNKTCFCNVVWLENIRGTCLM